jgi:hypothetical protein
MLISIVSRTAPQTIHFPRKSTRHSSVKIYTVWKWGGAGTYFILFDAGAAEKVHADRLRLVRVDGRFHVHAWPQHQA